MPDKQNEIRESKLILAEGKDAQLFFVWACEALGASGVQVMDFGSKDNLRAFLLALCLSPGFEQVKTMVIAEDADTDAAARVSSIGSALRAAGMPDPHQPFRFEDGSPRIAYVLFPGLADPRESGGRLLNGTLEDLCLLTVSQDQVMPCVEEFIECVESKGDALPRRHKAMLHAFLSAKDRFVGLKLGEAARVKAWDWNHPALDPYRRIVGEM